MKLESRNITFDMGNGEIGKVFFNAYSNKNLVGFVNFQVYKTVKDKETFVKSYSNLRLVEDTRNEDLDHYLSEPTKETEIDGVKKYYSYYVMEAELKIALVKIIEKEIINPQKTKQPITVENKSTEPKIDTKNTKNEDFKTL